MAYADLVPLGAPPPGTPMRRRREAERHRYAEPPTRRGFLAGVLAVGVGAGVAALGVFPKARAALADPAPGQYGYRIYTACPPYAAGHQCEPGCGPSQVLADTCEPSGQYYGWFKNRPAEGYRLRPGACWAGFDGWTWGYNGPCGNCGQHTLYRCHDGYKAIGGGWYPKICRKVIECDGRDPDAPVFHDPVGTLVSARVVAPGKVRLKGWAIDPDATRSAVTVGIYQNGRLVARPVANRRSNAIPPFFWSSGLQHGFDVTITGVRPGEHRFKVFASSIGPGKNTKLGERLIRMHSGANRGTG